MRVWPLIRAWVLMHPFPHSSFGPGMQAPVDPAQAELAFVTACRAVFYRWTTLRLAVTNGWGGGDGTAKEELMLTEMLGLFGRGMFRF